MPAARAYYNELDGAAAHVLECLISDGIIAPGDVDRRSIRDVMPADLDGFTQCHWFAGGGLWSVAARLAGFPDERELWTGSCPCQPFSVAGKGAGIDDVRHLWPDFFRLIRARRPAVVMGEQVAGKAGRDWFHGVRTDLEGGGYAGRAVDIPALAVDAPHIRQRLYWLARDLADANSGRQEGRRIFGPGEGVGAHGKRSYDQSGRPDGRVLAVADTDGGRRPGRQEDAQRNTLERNALERITDVALVDAASDGRGKGRPEYELWSRRPAAAGTDAPSHMADAASCGWFEREPATEATRYRDSFAAAHGGANGSNWANAEWLTCHDGKARRSKPGLRLLVNGLSRRVDLWRIGGNAISPVLAAEIIRAYLDTEGAQ